MTPSLPSYQLSWQPMEYGQSPLFGGTQMPPQTPSLGSASISHGIQNPNYPPPVFPMSGHGVADVAQQPMQYGAFPPRQPVGSASQWQAWNGDVSSPPPAMPQVSVQLAADASLRPNLPNDMLEMAQMGSRP